MEKEIKKTIDGICKDIKKEVTNDYELMRFLEKELDFTLERLRGDLGL